MGSVFVEHAGGGGTVEGVAVFGLELGVAIGTLKDGTVPIGIGNESSFMAMRTGTLESYELGIRNATDKDALMATVDGDGTSNGEERGEFRLIDIDGSTIAKGCVAEIVAGAGN